MGRNLQCLEIHKKERRAACTNCTVSPSVSDTVYLSMWDIGSVEAPIAAPLKQMSLFVPFCTGHKFPLMVEKTKWWLLHINIAGNQFCPESPFQYLCLIKPDLAVFFLSHGSFLMEIKYPDDNRHETDLSLKTSIAKSQTI